MICPIIHRPSSPAVAPRISQGAALRNQLAARPRVGGSQIERDPVALRPNLCNLQLAILLSAQNAKLSLVLHMLKCDLGDVPSKTLLCRCSVIPI